MEPLAGQRPVQCHIPRRGGKPLDTYAQVLTPVLAKLLAVHLDAVVGQAARPEHTAPSRTLPLSLETYLYVLSAAHYQAVREVLAYGTFAQVEGSPWPTAQLTQGHARSHAQLRPVLTDQQPFLPPAARSNLQRCAGCADRRRAA